LLGDGDIAPVNLRNWRQRLPCKLGRKLVMRNGRVRLHANCLIHPEARFCPRASEIRMGENGSVAGGAAVQGNVSSGNNCSVQANTLLVGYSKSPDDIRQPPARSFCNCGRF
jgi:hypothetical protein